MRHTFERARLAEAASVVLKEQASRVDVYGWMKRYGIGESDFGALLDAMGRGRGVFFHRLHGHHPIYDFPWTDPGHIPDFLEHVFVSDAFTKQGLPILPGKFLADSRIIRYCSARTLEWDFVNAFDLLSGTLAIYAGYKQLTRFFDGQDSIDSFGQLAYELGIGALELALAVTQQNPFTLFGVALHLAGTLRGVLNDSAAVYFRRIVGKYYILVTDPTQDLDEAIRRYYPNTADPHTQLDQKVRDYYEGLDNS